MAETNGGATRGRRKLFLQKFFAGNLTKHIKIASGNATKLAAIVTHIANIMLLIRLSLIAILDHITGKREKETLADFQKTNSTGYPVKTSKNNSIAKKSDFIAIP
ncbi:MAG: hypothetical protein NC902_07170 [Candidatus Omnitrophica bacterium]|nr:hypothetical protein [Candidatus Omnitrophota bacterium]